MPLPDLSRPRKPGDALVTWSERDSLSSYTFHFVLGLLLALLFQGAEVYQLSLSGRRV